jgi:hypothetical protein
VNAEQGLILDDEDGGPLHVTCIEFLE